MKGVVLSWRQNEKYSNGDIRGEDGKRYRVTGKQVEPDCIGRIYLEPKEPVEFDVARIPDKRKGGTRRCAINVRRPFKETEIDPATHREICVVLDKYWILRKLGGLLTVDPYDPMFDILETNTLIECGIRENPPSQTWRAVDIRILTADEVPVGTYDVPENFMIKNDFTGRRVYERPA